MEKELKELKELNKTMNSIKSFIVANCQLSKNILLELQKLNRSTKWQQ